MKKENKLMDKIGVGYASVTDLEKVDFPTPCTPPKKIIFPLLNIRYLLLVRL